MERERSGLVMNSFREIKPLRIMDPRGSHRYIVHLYVTVQRYGPQCCGFGSRILIFIHPGSRIPQQHQKRSGKFFLSTIFCGKKGFSTKTELLYTVLFTQEFVISVSYQKYGLGSGIRIKTYSGSRIQGQKGIGSRFRIRNTDKTRTRKQICP
jgi:hypothetical protein